MQISSFFERSFVLKERFASKVVLYDDLRDNIYEIYQSFIIQKEIQCGTFHKLMADSVASCVVYDYQQT